MRVLCRVGMETGTVTFPMHLNADTLERAMRCPPDKAGTYAPLLSEACAAYSIDTPARMSAFLAQIGHESGGLRYTAEIWGPTQAQMRYEGRSDLGNVEPGDGERFRGRGLIQTTGRHNYRAVRDRLRKRLGDGVPDFEAEPDRLADPFWAAWSAADYWGWKDLNPLADAGDFLTITRKINGGTNGLADRERRWEIARTALGATASRPAPIETRTVSKEKKPMSPFIQAALPSLIDAIPRLGKLFGSGSKVAERNVAAAETVVGIVQQAVGARNVQEAVEAIKADPAALAAATKAVEDQWFSLTEAGGGGIEGARKADQAAMMFDGPWWSVLRSPSFIVACLLLPLVYLIVLSIIGVVGSAAWSDDVRAAIAGTIVGSIIGGLVGYYYGQTTSRNRGGPVPPQ